LLRTKRGVLLNTGKGCFKQTLYCISLLRQR
jgi:hypothetical protein